MNVCSGDERHVEGCGGTCGKEPPPLPLRCYFCGLFMSWKEEIAHYDPTVPSDYEPREVLPCHPRCKK